MTDYAIVVKHPGFIDRFLISATPPNDIGMSLWWAIRSRGEPRDAEEKRILRFRSRESAEHVKRNYELHFAAAQEKLYSFVVMKLVLVPKWVECEFDPLGG